MRADEFLFTILPFLFRSKKKKNDIEDLNQLKSWNWLSDSGEKYAGNDIVSFLQDIEFPLMDNGLPIYSQDSVVPFVVANSVKVGVGFFQQRRDAKQVMHGHALSIMSQYYFKKGDRYLRLNMTLGIYLPEYAMPTLNFSTFAIKDFDLFWTEDGSLKEYRKPFIYDYFGSSVDSPDKEYNHGARFYTPRSTGDKFYVKIGDRIHDYIMNNNILLKSGINYFNLEIVVPFIVRSKNTTTAYNNDIINLPALANNVSINYIEQFQFELLMQFNELDSSTKWKTWKIVVCDKSVNLDGEYTIYQGKETTIYTTNNYSISQNSNYNYTKLIDNSKL